MPPRLTQLVLWMAILAFAVIAPGSAPAQSTGATLSGAIRDASGKVAANARISVKELATGKLTEVQADAGGLYQSSNLAPGEYEISASADGLGVATTRVTLAQGDNPAVNLTLGEALSLKNLGFSPGQTQGNAQDQARLDKRSHMLKVHQRIGLIATVPIVASVFSGPFAGGKSTSSANRWTHLALGSAAGDLYFLSAYYAIRAPRIPGTETRGPIRLHKILAWIHGPGMIMTPILGALAFDQKSKGEKLHGIASAHGAVAVVTAAAYGAAILSVSVKF